MRATQCPECKIATDTPPDQGFVDDESLNFLHSRGVIDTTFVFRFCQQVRGTPVPVHRAVDIYSM